MSCSDARKVNVFNHSANNFICTSYRNIITPEIQPDIIVENENDYHEVQHEVYRHFSMNMVEFLFSILFFLKNGNELPILLF